MWDIVGGILIIILASLVLYRVGQEVRRRAPEAVVVLLGLSTTALLVWFAVSVRGAIGVARILPLSNAIVLGNPVPLGAAFLAGLASGDHTVPGWRRWLATFLLLAVAWRTNSFGLSGEMPSAVDRWSVDRVCLQTTPSSCSACCAVMLLRQCGIRSDETEMIRLCLTDSKGTTPLGLYRGLRIKTRGTPWKVEIVDGRVEQLRAKVGGPVLIFVRLGDIGDGPGMLPRWKGHRSQHSVVVYAFGGDGLALVGDPAVGLRRRTRDWLQKRWTGQGLRLIRREPAERPTQQSKPRATARAPDCPDLTPGRPLFRSGGGPGGGSPAR